MNLEKTSVPTTVHAPDRRRRIAATSLLVALAPFLGSCTEKLSTPGNQTQQCLTNAPPPPGPPVSGSLIHGNLSGPQITALLHYARSLPYEHDPNRSDVGLVTDENGNATSAQVAINAQCYSVGWDSTQLAAGRIVAQLTVAQTHGAQKLGGHPGDIVYWWVYQGPNGWQTEWVSSLDHNPGDWLEGGFTYNNHGIRNPFAMAELGTTPHARVRRVPDALHPSRQPPPLPSTQRMSGGNFPWFACLLGCCEANPL